MSSTHVNPLTQSRVPDTPSDAQVSGVVQQNSGLFFLKQPVSRSGTITQANRIMGIVIDRVAPRLPLPKHLITRCFSGVSCVMIALPVDGIADPHPMSSGANPAPTVDAQVAMTAETLTIDIDPKSAAVKAAVTLSRGRSPTTSPTRRWS